MSAPSLCSIEGCGEPVFARGWCQMHYRRWMRHGDAAVKLERPSPARDFLREVIQAGEFGDACLIWPFAKSNGYPSLGQGRRSVLVHRKVCEAVHGPAPAPDHDAAHLCGVRACINGRHLRWASRAENMSDTLVHGTHTRGERNGNAKLTEDAVRLIRRDKTTSRKDLARRFEVSERAVRLARARKSWAWLE